MAYPTRSTFTSRRVRGAASIEQIGLLSTAAAVAIAIALVGGNVSEVLGSVGAGGSGDVEAGVAGGDGSGGAPGGLAYDPDVSPLPLGDGFSVRSTDGVGGDEDGGGSGGDSGGGGADGPGAGGSGAGGEGADGPGAGRSGVGGDGADGLGTGGSGAGGWGGGGWGGGGSGAAGAGGIGLDCEGGAVSHAEALRAAMEGRDHLSADDLEQLTRDGSVDPALRRAAQFFLSNPALRHVLERGGEGGDDNDRIGRDDLETGIAALRELDWDAFRTGAAEDMTAEEAQALLESLRMVADVAAGRGSMNDHVSHDDYRALATENACFGDGAAALVTWAAENLPEEEAPCAGWTCGFRSAGDWVSDRWGDFHDFRNGIQDWGQDRLDDLHGLANQGMDWVADQAQGLEDWANDLPGPLDWVASPIASHLSWQADFAAGAVDATFGMASGLNQLANFVVDLQMGDPQAYQSLASFGQVVADDPSIVWDVAYSVGEHIVTNVVDCATGDGRSCGELAPDVALTIATGGIGKAASIPERLSAALPRLRTAFTRPGRVADEVAALADAAGASGRAAPALTATGVGEVPPLIVMGKTGLYNWAGDGELSIVDDVVEVAGGTVNRGGGGVATAVDSMRQMTPRMVTIAQPAGRGDRALAEMGALWRVGDQQTAFVHMADDVAEGFTYTSAELLWMWQHRLPNQITWTRNWELDWARYMEAQTGFANRALAQSTRMDDALFIVNDFQLYGVPQLIRAQRAEASILHFTHIPFPNADEWAVLAARLGDDYVPETITRSLLHSDVAGFQTARDAQNFVDTALRYVPDARATALDDGGWIVTTSSGSQTLVRPYPISVDAGEVHRALEAGRAATHARRVALDEYVDGLDQTIVSVARLDPMKNTQEGLLAYERLLETRPELHGRLGFVEMMVPTRTDVPVYRAYQDETLAMIERINTRYGTADWQPIHYVYESQPYSDVVYAMSRADVQFIPSGWDGMNLTAKEAMIANPNSALVVSERVGASDELGPLGAITLDPDNVDDVTRALAEGLDMPAGERARRGAAMSEHIEQNGLDPWIQAQLEDVRRMRGPDR